MVWQSYENQNIILDEPMAEQLSQYLENKESLLSAKIVEVILQFEGLPSLSEAVNPHSFRLSEAVEEFGKKISRAAQVPKNTLTKDQWRFAAKQVNQALWNYVEVLEGCVIELFQQINQIGFEQWNVDVIRAATSIKDELTHRMDDLIWAVRRLEQQLKLYRKICDIREGKWVGLRKVFYIFSRLLDRNLEPTVRKCNKYLNFHYRKFIERYTGYLQLYENVHQPMKRFSHYRVLTSMDITQQEKVKELYFLINLWEKNRKDRILQRTETVRAIRSSLSFENALILFKDYFFSIREAIFDKSRMIKKQFRLVFTDKQSKQPLIDNVNSYRAELKELKELVTHYKKFHLQTDPGSKNWFRNFFYRKCVKLPKHFQELDELNYKIKNLETVAASFQTALECEPHMERGLTSAIQNEVNKYLHEMGQPLASKDLMRRNAKALMQSLQSLDELASFDPNVVDFISHTLSKAMCADWKYQVLQEISLFHQIYEIHQMIFNISHERQHVNRLLKFKRILNQLEQWIKNQDTLKHAQEIDLDIQDIKAYLQDFLAYVQRLDPEDNISDDEKFEHPIGKTFQALLQYLYLFGTFFSHLNYDDPEHRLIRKQLLFIDQYFEAIDRRIQSLSKI